ncbi:MAG TPA: hypothetical protein VFW92_06975 [Candidatus Limnocylindrales bacterium]|nr:hypothetical protein [Candidatus Limnocylindrales bacterium]
MRVRLFELRLLAVLLFALWSGAFALMAVEYHPGGPYDLAVAGAALLPCLVAGLAVLWPPLARGDRAAVAIGWLGVVGALLLVPSVGGLAGPLLGAAGQPILPAPEVAYAALLALFVTCLFCGLGLARELLGETALRGRRLVLGVVLALALTSVVGTAFGAAAVANDVALQARAQPPSVWGPTDPAVAPPTCGGPLDAGPDALVSEAATAKAGAATVGSVTLEGARSGDDERWMASLTLAGTTTQRAYVRVGSRAWSRTDEGAWAPTSGSGLGSASASASESDPASASVSAGGSDSGSASAVGPTLDGAVLAAALAPAQRVAADDAGIELIGGARARHCRTTVAGAAALASFPPLRWLAGGPLPDSSVLGPWRGQLDWWVFGDGQLGLVTVHLTGPSPAAWSGASVLGTLDARLQAIQRDDPEVVLAPE